MSERCIPLDIQKEILRRIPDVKSLIRFRSVSKTWKSFIDSSQFITHHTQRDHHHHHHHIFLCYKDHRYSERKYVSIVDDDSFPRHKFPLPIPFSCYYPYYLLGTSSHGLFCFRVGKTVAVVWNPSIRKSITIDLPSHMLDWSYDTLIGFGVCPHTLHFKLIKISYISYIRDSSELENLSRIPCQVEVFSGAAWRSPLCINNLPRKTIKFDSDEGVVIDRFIYWHAYDMSLPYDYSAYGLIISFDLTSEEFTEIYLPNDLAHSDLYISKLKESLVMLEPKRVSNERAFDVWKMEHGVSKTFSKLYTISTPGASVLEVLVFRKSGEPIITIEDEDNQESLYVYEPDSRNIKDIGISGQSDMICWSSYVETLLLLDY